MLRKYCNWTKEVNISLYLDRVDNFKKWNQCRKDLSSKFVLSCLFCDEKDVWQHKWHHVVVYAFLCQAW